MNTLADRLRQKADEMRSDLEAAQQDIALAKVKEEAIAASLASYEQAHQEALRQSRADGAGQKEGTEPQVPSTDDAPNKTGVVESIVDEGASRGGVAAADVYAEFVRRDIPIKHPYVYSILNRLKKRGRITLRRGRYVPAARKVANIAAG